MTARPIKRLGVPCPWAKNEVSLRYHDTEWGVPLHDDRGLFEFLILEGAQAGLSWDTILKKRGTYRRAYANFDIARVAAFTVKDQRRLLADAGIVRNRLKISTSIANARAALLVIEQEGSLDRYLWSFVGGLPKQNRWDSIDQVPAITVEATAMSKALLKRGFRFVGPTICYAFMQATGMVNDHLAGCPRYSQLMVAGSRNDP